MSQPNLAVTSPHREQDADELIELCSRCFGRYYDFRRDLRQWKLLGGSHYDWNASAIGRVDGALVTHYGVWDYQMRVGESLVRCGGVGLVATDGEYRKQGLMDRTIPHSLSAMRALGYDLSILFGIPDFYHRFGYVRAWNEESWFITRDRLPRELPTVAFEPYKVGPREDIARMHNRLNRATTGSALRPTYSAYTRSGQDGYLWRDGRGRLIGHVIVSELGGRLVCSECLGDVDEVMAVLSAIALRMGLKELQFDALPFNSAMGQRLRQLTCRLERRYAQSADAMARIINLESCLRKMTAALEGRLADSPLAGCRGELAIQSAEEQVTLTLTRGKVRVSAGRAAGAPVIRGGHHIAELLLGSDDPMETCALRKIRLNPQSARLVQVLFPNEHPQLQIADRY